MICISTGLNTPELARSRCLRSVREQVGVEVQHTHFDAGATDPPLAHFAYLTQMLLDLRPSEIVVSLDLDDWLERPDALAIVQKHHDEGAWMTWGSFKFSDGRKGFASDFRGDARTEPWVLTHLKSYRAGIFNRIRVDDLKMGGEWLTHARDLAVMLPAYEMCPPERRHFIEETLYVYNFANAGEFRNGEAWRNEERRCVAHVRGLKPYERVATL